jgi:TRAP-type C4-dicarboxylate transport system permease small subunit
LAEGKENVMRVIRFMLVDAVEFVLVCLMVALCVDLFVGVYTRYVVGQAAPWYDEVARYLFIWMSFLGAAVAVRRKVHFVVHLIVDRFHGWARLGTEILCWFIVMGFSVFLFVQGIRVMEGVSVQVSPALGLTLSWVFLAVPVHGFLSFLYASAHLWDTVQPRIKRGRS